MSSNQLPIAENSPKIPKRAKRKWYKNPKVWRQGSMFFFFVFLTHVAHEHLKNGGGPNGDPSVEAYCPFGGLESLYQFITTGGYIRHIETSTMIIFGAVVLLTLLFSRGFCSWICPFGSIQEWIGMLGRRVLGKRFNPTGTWDRVLRYFKYVVLAAIIALTWWTGAMVFRDYDPFLAFFHLGEGIDEKPWGYSFLLITLIGSFFIERFFCKYACPLGAFLAILGKFGLTKIHRDTEGCKECNICYQNCNAHVDFLAVTDIRDAECNHCLDCVVDCPKPNVLTARATKWRFSHPAYATLMVVGLFGLIGVSKATSVWQTEPEEVVVRNAAGELEAETIRGWMTLNVISQEFGIPLEQLYADTQLPARVSPDVMVKEIHNEYEIDFEPDIIREVVDARLHGAPAPDVAAMRAAGSERRKDRPAGRAAGSKEEGEGEPPAVRGNSTINEIILNTGIPKDYLLKEAGLPADVPTRTALRDWIFDYDRSPRDLRDVVEKYLEEKQ